MVTLRKREHKHNEGVASKAVIQNPFSSPGKSISRKKATSMYVLLGIGCTLSLLIFQWNQPVAWASSRHFYDNYDDALTSLAASSRRRKASATATKEAVKFESGNPAYDAAFQLAMNEVEENTVNGKFIAGAGWTQLWTRDTSYAVELAAAILDPVASEVSLRACTHSIDGIGVTWLQDDCGHFGGWPKLTDAIVGAQGAWSLYLSTGDKEFLRWAYSVTNNTLVWAERDVYSEKSSLFKGCSSFMESDSGYPSKYHHNGDLVGQTKALSTNVLYYNGYKLAAMMGEELGLPPSDTAHFAAKAESLRSSIRSRFWMPDKGYYAYVENEEDMLMPRMEGLGEALLLLSPDLETDISRVDSIFENTYRSNNGIPCLWPRFHIEENPRDIASFYHNGRIWPFVQGYWALAAARHGKVDVFAQEFEHLVSLSKSGNTFAEFYELDGSFHKERTRQLWSDTGFLSMVFNGLFGMQLQPNGLEFRPVKPASIVAAETISLRNVQYREATLNIFVSGSGSNVVSFKLNDVIQPPFIPSNITGIHNNIEIILRCGSTS